MRKTIINLKLCITVVVIHFLNQTTYAQIGNIIWEDNFDTFNEDIWTPNVGDGCDEGICGWGNAELEYYSPNNVYIATVDGEPGNNALVLEAKNENAGTQSFTSGKVDSDGKLSVQYGLIEIRLKTPDLDTGLWPAAWLLGTANLSWPAKGEIDMMEMGHAVAERERQGHSGADINSYVGANAIFANEDGSVGSIAWDVDYDQPYIASTPMNDRYVTYRLYWEPTQMRFTVVDNGVENDLYTNPLGLNAEGVTSVFQKPFFFLMNLAVGGNFTDALSVDEVTAPIPAKMYIDYVKVYEYNGYGSVEFDTDVLVTESGPFGVFTEETSTNNSLSFGLDSEIYVWGETMQDGATEAYEGNEVLAWETLTADGWFGGGITSTFGSDMSGYVEEGVLKFDIKIPADVSFRIGITDNYTNESWITFNANEEQYGLVRNGEWGQVEIPLIDFAGSLAFQNINYMFAISSVDGDFPSSTIQIGIDDIVWDDGNPLTADVNVTGISVTPISSVLLEGETEQLNAIIIPSDATNQNVTWLSSDETIVSVNANGLVTANTVGSATITVTTKDGNYIGTTNISVNTTTDDFSPDPTKRYYIDSPIHNLRIASSGESEEPYTTSTNTIGDDVTWKFVDKGNGYWHIERATGGSLPRLRTDNSENADMQAITSSGVFTYYELTEGFTEGTYFVTLPNGPANYKRLQVNNLGEIKMVSTASNRTWESFTFTEVLEEETPVNTSVKIEAEDYVNMSGIQTEESDDDDTLNVGWIDMNDWLEYEVTIVTAGVYDLDIRIASPNLGAMASFQVNGSDSASISISNTGDWQNWETISTTTIPLESGTHTLRLTSVGNGFNINWLEIKPQTSSKSSVSKKTLINELKLYPNPVTNELNVSLSNKETIKSISIIDLNGRVLTQNKAITTNLIKFNTSDLSSGVYLLRVTSTKGIIGVKRFIK